MSTTPVKGSALPGRLGSDVDAEKIDMQTERIAQGGASVPRGASRAITQKDVRNAGTERGAREWHPPAKRPDSTGIFGKKVPWKEKIRLLGLAKREAWDGGSSPFTRRLLGQSFFSFSLSSRGILI